MVTKRFAKPSSRNAFRVRITDAPLRKDMSFLIEVSITSPFAARMILLRTERDRPAVFIEHLSHYARSETQPISFAEE